MREAIEVSIEYYYDDMGRSLFEEWYNTLDRSPKEVVLDAVDKRRKGNTGNSRPVGGGVHELRARGFRIYYATQGAKLIILLGGGTKRRQQSDIDAAKSSWWNYKQRKRGQP